MNFDFNDNSNRDEILKALREEELVHIEVSIENDKHTRNKSPLGLLADSFEYLVNRLLFNIKRNNDQISASYITFLQMELDKFIALSSMLSELPDISDIEILDSSLLTVPKKSKKKTPIPQVFLDAFKEVEE